MKHPFKTAGLIAAALSNAVWAEEPTLFQGDEIVVTASRTPQSLHSSLGDVSVITAAEIAKAGQSTLAELLQSQPGVEITTNGGMGSTSRVFIRGANDVHTLVLVDGMRIESATYGLTILEHIPLSQVERIEILRGPASALYGSDAIGGVIQIFTKAGKGAQGTNLSAGLGSYNTRSMSAGMASETNGTRFGLQAGYVSSDGFSAIGNRANASFNPDKDGYRDGSVTGTVAHEFAPGQELGLNLFYSAAKMHFDSRPTQDDNENHTLSAYSAYSRNRVTGNWESFLRLGASADDSAVVSGTPGTFRTDENQLTWQNNITTGVGLVTAGVERLEQKVTSTTVYAKTSRTNDSLLLGYQGSYGAHGVQANVRHDDNSQFGNHDTGSLAYGYRFAPHWRAVASMGTAFKAPTFNQLYYPGSGNPNLRPERARNREIGLHYAGTAQRGSLVYFDNRVADLIDWAQVSGVWVPNNISQATLRGATLDWQGEVGAWHLGANFTAQRAEDDATGHLLQRRAKQYGAVKAGRSFGAWDLGSELVFAGERYDDTANTKRMGGYGLVNLTAGYAVTKELSLHGRINNLFDKHYELVRDYNTPGANIFVSLEYHPR